MKIRELQLKNIGVFDNEIIEFPPCPEGKAEIHILTGQNGSGKSTILQALVSAFDNGVNIDHSPYLPLKNSLYKRFKYINRRDKDKIINQIQVIFRNEVVANTGFPEGASIRFTHKDLFQDPKFVMLRLILLEYQKLITTNSNTPNNLINGLSFAAFAFSGYRQIQSERVEAIKEPKDFNPLSQSLEFIKDYSQANELTINQLIANNISKSAIEKGRNKEKSDRFANVIKSVEKAIIEITNLKVEFDLETEPINLITKVNDKELDFDILPDGLRSLISWIADLLSRVDLLKWQDDLPITEKNLIIFLDEIEVHLHPAWQRKVLPAVQKIFKNSQIFVSTHSPFVVNSVDDAWVHKLELENGKAKIAKPEKSEDARSYRYVLRNTFDIDEEFGIEIEKRLKDFYEQRDIVLAGNGNSKKAKTELKKIAKELASQSKELKRKIDFELFQLSEITGEDFD